MVKLGKIKVTCTKTVVVVALVVVVDLRVPVIMVIAVWAIVMDRLAQWVSVTEIPCPPLVDK